ncbi:hypothetical protein [Polaromonas sp. YR568]|uniref:hypothetical protein n=1 Tax=Polaromonas sp. YR568 TaxID=1855301 RepID=UPI00398BE865
MPYLSNAQRNLLAPAGEDHPRDGETVPTSDQVPFANAACWGWALTGEYESVDNAYTAATIYNSDEGAFVFDNDRVPTGLNDDFFNTTDIIFPQTVPFHQVLTDNFDAALDGDEDAQDVCRVALMSITAQLNGHTVLGVDGPEVYTMVMKSSSWYGWDHWGIGVQATDGVTTTWQQKVSGSQANPQALQYNCGVMWDEHLPLETVLRLDGLLRAQVDMLNNVV